MPTIVDFVLMAADDNENAETVVVRIGSGLFCSSFEFALTLFNVVEKILRSKRERIKAKVVICWSFEFSYLLANVVLKRK